MAVKKKRVAMISEVRKVVGWEEDVDLRAASWCGGGFLPGVVDAYGLKRGEVVILTNRAKTRVRFVMVGVAGVPQIVCPQADSADSLLSIYLKISIALSAFCPDSVRPGSFVEEVQEMHDRRAVRRAKAKRDLAKRKKKR